MKLGAELLGLDQTQPKYRKDEDGVIHIEQRKSGDAK